NLAGDTVTVTVAADAGLGDFVFLDENSNGVPDPGEAGFEGVVVELYDGQLNLLATTITDADGIYTFTGLEPAAYVVGFKAPPGFDFSAGADESGRTPLINLGCNEFNPSIDAGLKSAPTATVPTVGAAGLALLFAGFVAAAFGIARYRAVVSGSRDSR
ncbi:MAG: hypothetical protein HKO62_09275, partial [Gammaproteobacteria bacterium]|nr:hypothetical protein [Gammaproteobacteria bacterium]